MNDKGTTVSHESSTNIITVPRMTVSAKTLMLMLLMETVNGNCKRLSCGTRA